MERLWKVAWCFFNERTQKHKVHQWVEERLKRLLEGKVDAGIRGLLPGNPAWFEGTRAEDRAGAAEYFERNRDRMKYDEYLAAGYPIGSGVVEGACRHLVKDRMEWDRDALAAVRMQAMLDQLSHLPQWRVECLLELPRDAGRPTALRQNTESWVTPTQ